jgi:hypothetical protein
MLQLISSQSRSEGAVVENTIAGGYTCAACLLDDTSYSQNRPYECTNKQLAPSPLHTITTVYYMIWHYTTNSTQNNVCELDHSSALGPSFSWEHLAPSSSATLNSDSVIRSSSGKFNQMVTSDDRLLAIYSTYLFVCTVLSSMAVAQQTAIDLSGSCT